MSPDGKGFVGKASELAVWVEADVPRSLATQWHQLAPLPWMWAEGSTMCALSCRCFARPPSVGPLMTLRAGWRLGQANYMALSPPRPNNYTATYTERVANCVTSCEGRARAPPQANELSPRVQGAGPGQGMWRAGPFHSQPPMVPSPWEGGRVCGRKGSSN